MGQPNRRSQRQEDLLAAGLPEPLTNHFLCLGGRILHEQESRLALVTRILLVDENLLQTSRISGGGSGHVGPR